MPSGKSFAKEEVMEEYLDDLLFDTADAVAATDRVAKLLEKATTEVVATEIEPVELVSTSIDEETNQPITALVDIKDVATEAETSKDAEPAITAQSLEERVPDRF